MKNIIKQKILRAVMEFKIGWNLTQEPEFIQKYEKNIYFKIFKLIGAFCLFLVVSGIAREFNKLVFYYVITYSLLYSIYRLVIGINSVIQFILIIFSGKLIVRNSPTNPYYTAFRAVSQVFRNTTGFTVSTGITFALCYELDEILLQEGKEAYFVPNMRNVIRQVINNIK
uniref:Uncharacterized protein n=1 Tax=Trametes hirsuta TaxID=5327 RepID=A0A2L2FNM3_TRAHI|nr:hypothetical protein THMit_0004 [Trametes hirsuta]AVG72794.1 hypothetical protein THMit_0004 [Trametes hirsuta]